MKMTLLGLLMAGMLGVVGGCVSDQRGMKTPADTQPRPYMDSVTNPQQQPGLDRTGSINR